MTELRAVFVRTCGMPVGWMPENITLELSGFAVYDLHVRSLDGRLLHNSRPCGRTEASKDIRVRESATRLQARRQTELDAFL